MGKKLWWLVVLAPAFLLAQEPVGSTRKEPVKDPKAQPAEEIWEAASIDQGHAGYFLLSFEPVEIDGQKVIRARETLNLTIQRFRQMAQIRMQSGTDETADGKVVGVFMRIEQGDGALILEGKVKDNLLHVEVPKVRMTRQIPWNDKVIGLRAQERLFQGKPFKPGDTKAFQSFEPSLNAVVNLTATVHDEEEVELSKKEKRKLFRAVLASEKIEAPQGKIQLPPITVWMDREGKILRRQVQIDGLGKVLLVRTTKEVATAQSDPSTTVDIGLKNLIPLNRRIPRPNGTESAVYRITIDDEKPETALKQDNRQQVKNVKEMTFELHVKAVRAAPEDGKGEAGKEFLANCHYLDWEDARVQELAKEAVGGEADPWFKARRIEGLVHRKMRLDQKIPFVPAGQVAQQLRGDCRQHALLTAAMCRAAGVPSRTAIGLVYAEVGQGRAIFGFHMWVEVFVRGEWLGLDSTLGEGSVGATHIKVTDHSWDGVQSLTPLLPLHRVLGKMKIEVVQVGH